MTLANLLEECLSNYTPNAASLAEKVTDAALEVQGGSRRAIVHLRGAYGLDGASTKKLRNVVFNWRKLLVDVIRSGWKVGVHAESEWVIILACLQFLNKFHQRLTVELAPQHAVLVWCLGIGTDVGSPCQIDDLLDCANERLSEAGQIQLSLGELREHLTQLEQLRTVQSTTNGEWVLCETVRLVP